MEKDKESRNLVTVKTLKPQDEGECAAWERAVRNSTKYIVTSSGILEPIPEDLDYMVDQRKLYLEK